MLDKWHNLKDEQPKLIHSTQDCYDGNIIKYSNPILLIINNIPLIGYYANEVFEADDGEIINNYVVEITGHTSLYLIIKMTEENFTDGECFSIDDLIRLNIDAYWSEIDMTNVSSQIDLLKNEKQIKTKQRKGKQNGRIKTSK